MFPGLPGKMTENSSLLTNSIPHVLRPEKAAAAARTPARGARFFSSHRNLPIVPPEVSAGNNPRQTRNVLFVFLSRAEDVGTWWESTKKREKPHTCCCEKSHKFLSLSFFFSFRISRLCPAASAAVPLSLPPPSPRHPDRYLVWYFRAIGVAPRKWSEIYLPPIQKCHFPIIYSSGAFAFSWPFDFTSWAIDCALIEKFSYWTSCTVLYREENRRGDYGFFCGYHARTCI